MPDTVFDAETARSSAYELKNLGLGPEYVLSDVGKSAAGHGDAPLTGRFEFRPIPLREETHAEIDIPETRRGGKVATENNRLSDYVGQNRARGRSLPEQ